LFSTKPRDRLGRTPLNDQLYVSSWTQNLVHSLTLIRRQNKRRFVHVKSGNLYRTKSVDNARTWTAVYSWLRFKQAVAVTRTRIHAFIATATRSLVGC